MKKEIELKIKSTQDNVELIGHTVNKLSSESGLQDNESSLLELAVVESVNNSIKHSYKNNPDNEIIVRIIIGSQNIEIKIIDHGEPIPEFKTNYPDDFDINDLENLPEGGRGLFIIDQIADNLSYQTFENQNILTIIKNLVPKN